MFLAYGAVDALYAYYTLCVTRRQALRAAFCSVGIYLLIGTGVLAFTRSAWYLLPAAAGGFLGTFAVVKRSQSS